MLIGNIYNYIYIDHEHTSILNSDLFKDIFNDPIIFSKLMSLQVFRS